MQTLLKVQVAQTLTRRQLVATISRDIRRLKADVDRWEHVKGWSERLDDLMILADELQDRAVASQYVQPSLLGDQESWALSEVTIRGE